MQSQWQSSKSGSSSSRKVREGPTVRDRLGQGWKGLWRLQLAGDDMRTVGLTRARRAAAHGEASSALLC